MSRQNRCHIYIYIGSLFVRVLWDLGIYAEQSSRVLQFTRAALWLDRFCGGKGAHIRHVNDGYNLYVDLSNACLEQ